MEYLNKATLQMDIKALEDLRDFADDPSEENLASMQDLIDEWHTDLMEQMNELPTLIELAEDYTVLALHGTKALVSVDTNNYAVVDVKKDTKTGKWKTANPQYTAKPHMERAMTLFRKCVATEHTSTCDEWLRTFNELKGSK